MLKELHIKNVAVIDEALIEFENGFNVLTGETGAGKSILIDSINMVIGSRSSKEIVRNGTDKAVVEALFEADSADVLEKLSEYGIDCDDGNIILSRQISAEGKSVSRCNGVIIPLNCTREIGELLVDIHGQNDNQKIMNRANHISYLDNYGKNGELLFKYKNIYTKYKEIISKLDEFNQNKDEKEKRIELIKYQINEIESANLKIGEDKELEERRTFLQNAEKILSSIQTAYEALYGGDSFETAYDLVYRAERNLSELKECYSPAEAFSDRLSSALAEIEDISGELKSFLASTDYSVGELEEVENRLSLIDELKRKYGNPVSVINDFLKNIKAEYETLIFGDENYEELISQKEECEKMLNKSAVELSADRQKTAKDLEKRISEELTNLDMPNVNFIISIEKCDYCKNGIDKVEFLISANKGEEPKPMNKIASGGELSRIMLAVKSVMSDFENSETMIFDEIDTGVSGRAAQKIAEKIAGFSGHCQVFAVTHLSQIAAMADTHFLIKKEDNGIRTFTKVEKLNKEERISELGRIIGGVSVTYTTLKSAEEMLEMAEKMKKDR